MGQFSPGRAAWWRSLALLASLCAGLSPAAHAGDGAGRLLVSAQVREHLSLRVVTQPMSVAITEADLARGFIDVPAAAQLAIRSNSRAGYALVFESRAEFVRATLVQGLGREVHLGPAGGMASLPPLGPGTTLRSHELGFRFLLSQAARTGVHPWPLSLSIVPL